MKNPFAALASRFTAAKHRPFSAGGWMKLARLVTACATSDKAGPHGEEHWRSVALAGNRICDLEPQADRAVVIAFALIHDSQRLTDTHDPQHGQRASDWARENPFVRRLLTNDQILTLCEACEDHDLGGTTDDPTIGACWDADRLNLWRLGVRPRREYLSVLGRHAGFADLNDMMREAWRYPPGWQDIFLRAQAAIDAIR